MSFYNFTREGRIPNVELRQMVVIILKRLDFWPRSSIFIFAVASTLAWYARFEILGYYKYKIEDRVDR